MSEAVVPQSVTIAAVPEQVRVARAFVAGVLGESHPYAHVALLLASELVTNSVRHSGSAVPGGLVTVTVAVGDDSVRVEVTDRSGDSAPILLPGCCRRCSGCTSCSGCACSATCPIRRWRAACAVSRRRRPR